MVGFGGRCASADGPDKWIDLPRPECASLWRGNLYDETDHAGTVSVPQPRTSEVFGDSSYKDWRGGPGGGPVSYPRWDGFLGVPPGFLIFWGTCGGRGEEVARGDAGRVGV